jgi:hypothetical protein
VEKMDTSFDFVRRDVFVVSLAEDGNHSVANSDDYLSNAVFSFQEIASELNWAHLILVLNKKDLFEEQLKHTPMAQYFPNYNGDNSSHSAHKFIC